ncbi:interleukin-1 receptor-like 1 [Anabas testudineus]|uniref:Interleukin-1 receptor-like 1 n=1 Tax=Anabas testudineus TaxID=64144 RepID=A0A3Q1HEH2_ANATE|nr:interleukin-1 receptor-like 1 [Anabas testudineus]
MTASGKEEQHRHTGRRLAESTLALHTHFYELMDALRLFLLIIVMTSASECSETTKPPCDDYNMEYFNLLEGESFYFVPYVFYDISTIPHEEFTWYKNNSKVELISSDEKDRIHHHGGALFFLNLHPEDSGLYTARQTLQSGECSNYYVKVTVFRTSDKNNSKLLYGHIKNSDVNKLIPCPHPVKKTCKVFKGNFTWYKNFTPLQGEHEDHLRVNNAKKKDEGIYTCVCSWTHNQKVYNSSAARRLQMKERVIRPKIEILFPMNKEQFAAEGAGIKLNCSVLCGAGENNCHASWDVNGKPVNQMPGYNQTIETFTGKLSQYTISTAILVIEKVSAQDFQTEFTCSGVGFYSMNSTTLSLKREESTIPVLIRAICVLFVCVFAAVLLKCFCIDLTLLVRPYCTGCSHDQDMRTYDAYVVYQTQNMDKVTEDRLCRFVTNILPSVLEEKCGYRLFIHGRDDIPGEDSLELAEDRMKQSRRLMAILTLSSVSQSEITEKTPALPQNSAIRGFDWQVGLQDALVHRDKNVILIQLGDPGPQGYRCLYPKFQRLIHQSAPIRWQEESPDAAAWNSRFWKRVRYLMPATPVKKHPPSAII